jgi:ribonuclease HI
MEMTALIKALETIKKPNQVISVFSDSSYLIECFRKKWYLQWENNGWKTSKKTDVENRDLWERLFKLVQRHSISFYRVKGHVNLQNANTNIEKHYRRFLEWNGNQFTEEDFLAIIEKNNRADTLANKGVDSMKSLASQQF